MQRDPQPEAADAGALALFADHQVQAEVLRARATVGLGDGHRQEAAAPGEGEHLTRDEPVALPLP